MPDRLVAALRRQFDLTWSLLDLHLRALTDDDHLWEPAPGCWTVHRGTDGAWRPDWSEPEPDPAPATTVGWTSWHLGWWWTTVLAHATGAPVPDRVEVTWPGSAASTAGWLRGLRAGWTAVLDGLHEADLDRVAPFPWRDRPDRTVADMVAWVNAELMKNTAEIGQLRLLRAATAARRSRPDRGR